MSQSKHIAIVGSGPAGLMAASVLAPHGVKVTLFERKKGPAYKLLIAGRSGLNISNNHPIDSLYKFYDGPCQHFQTLFKNFSNQNWLDFVERLGIQTFEGASHRYFVKGLKSAPLLKAWIKDLKDKGVVCSYGMDLTDFDVLSNRVKVEFNHDKTFEFDALCLCLGGGSWGPITQKSNWPELFKNKGIGFKDFLPSNVGQEVNWNPDFLKEAEGLPLKNISVTSSQGTEFGEVIITRYGLEGTPIYNLKKSENIFLDLKPDQTFDQIQNKLGKSKENLLPLRRIKKYLNLCPAALALIYHQGPVACHGILSSGLALGFIPLIKLIKRFPIQLIKKRGLEEAISSAGGVEWSAMDENLMLKDFPGVFVAGEMLNWDAPTGGFLIQACVSEGYMAGKAILVYINLKTAVEVPNKPYEP